MANLALASHARMAPIINNIGLLGLDIDVEGVEDGSGRASLVNPSSFHYLESMKL